MGKNRWKKISFLFLEIGEKMISPYYLLDILISITIFWLVIVLSIWIIIKLQQMKKERLDEIFENLEKWKEIK